MASKREQILAALYTQLHTLQSATLNVYRNQDKPEKVSGGMIIMRDGVSEEPDVLLSPLTYIFQHLVHVEVLVQAPDNASRDSALDNLLSSIGNLVTGNRSLGGLAEWSECNAPAFTQEPIEGAPTVKMAEISIMVRFVTNDPLN